MLRIIYKYDIYLAENSIRSVRDVKEETRQKHKHKLNLPLFDVCLTVPLCVSLCES